MSHRLELTRRIARLPLVIHELGSASKQYLTRFFGVGAKTIARDMRVLMEFYPIRKRQTGREVEYVYEGELKTMAKVVEYKIIKNRPIPDPKLSQHGFMTKFLLSLEVGDSFDLPRRADGKRNATRHASLLTVARRANTPILVRKINESTDGVWRVREWPESPQRKPHNKEKNNAST